MAFYIKVTKQVAKKLGHSEDRNTTADDNKLLWQADLNLIEGETIFDRAANVGGVALTSAEAKEEIDGRENPVEVFTPDDYKDEEVPTEQKTEETPSDTVTESATKGTEEGGTL